MHEFTTRPSRRTLQAPQFPLPQPSFDPGEAEIVPEDFEEALPRLAEDLDVLAVQSESQS
jgi:hypothetical protein